MSQSAADLLPEVIEAISDHLANASTSFDIWREVQNADRRSDYEPAVIAYPCFFETLVVGQLVAVSSLLYAVNETRKDTHNFRSLLRIAKSCARDGTEFDAKEALLKRMHNQWTKISRIRNEVFAHRSAAREPMAVFSEIGITPDDVAGLIGEFKDVLRAIANKVSVEIPPILELDARYDTEEVMLRLAQPGAA